MYVRSENVGALPHPTAELCFYLYYIEYRYTNDDDDDDNNNNSNNIFGS